ncbi:MAG TPA: bifunctional nuclease family protein [Nitrospiria bacterium]|jgi:bifunctional DNase/RNase|nr:bifunctional nuclease family protein [Nitrospiria bacterium]
MDIKLSVQSVLTDPKTETQVVLLRAEGNKEVLPIWVGVTEGSAIKFALEGILPTRPMTHDLLKNVLDHLGLRVQKVIITEIKNNTYYALVYIESHGSLLSIDARPSDAIALALRTHVPIYAANEVFKERGGESLDAWLEKLGPKDSGEHTV